GVTHESFAYGRRRRTRPQSATTHKPSGREIDESTSRACHRSEPARYPTQPHDSCGALAVAPVRRGPVTPTLHSIPQRGGQCSSALLHADARVVAEIAAGGADIEPVVFG